MSSAFRLLIPVFTLAAVQACAGSAPPASGGTAATAMTAAAVRKGSANVIVEGEIPASGTGALLALNYRGRKGPSGGAAVVEQELLR